MRYVLPACRNLAGIRSRLVSGKNLHLTSPKLSPPPSPIKSVNQLLSPTFNHSAVLPIPSYQPARRPLLAASTTTPACISSRSPFAHAFSTSPVCRRDEEDKEKRPEGGVPPREKEKRLPSDDPSQLPDHLFSSRPQGQRKIKVGWFRRQWRDFHLKMLVYHSPEFVAEEFLEGARAAFERVMEKFAEGTTEGFEVMMTDRLRNGFSETLAEYKSHQLDLDMSVGALYDAQIVNASFVKDESGMLLVWVDVQFLSQQKFTLRDQSGRAVGDEGVWGEHVAVWRFQSPIQKLHWVLYDLL